mmetsp:Transcript_2130/g.5273  ORF Transcript_2130/g.5273 Transcript_2130/m.5273 type:complete len:937 (-) Transcript_2130:3789-6599(-)
MGNVQAYADYWNKLQNHMRDSNEVSVTEHNFIITNTHSYKTYYVNKRLMHSQLLFIATDDAADQVFLKIYELTSFEEVKKLNMYLKQVKEKLCETGLVKVLDYFFTFDKSRWVFVVVEEFIKGFTLESWLTYLSSDLIASKVKITIPADRAVSAFYEVIKRVKEAHDKGLVLTTITTTNVMLERTHKLSEDALLIWQDEAYIMKVAPYKIPGTKIPHQYVPPEGLTCRESYDIWCCGIVLLSAVLSESFHEIPILGRQKEADRFNFLTAKKVPQGVLQILQCCLADEDKRATSSELVLHHGIDIFCRISKLKIVIDEDDHPSENYVLESELPALNYFLTCESEEKQDCAMIQILSLMKVKMTVPVKYIIVHKLYKPIIYRINNTTWEPTLRLRDKLVFSGVKLGTLMMMQEVCLTHKMKKLGFMKIFLEAVQTMNEKKSLYEFIYKFSKHNTLTVMQLAHKHMLFQRARESASTASDMYSKEFIKNSISNYGSISIKLIERQHLGETKPKEILDMITDIPVHFKMRDCNKIIDMLSKVERSLKEIKKKKYYEKLENIKTIVMRIIELLFFWPWLKYAHAHDMCTNHVLADFMSFCRNPLLFICKECSTVLCVPCASKHYHPFTCLEYVGYMYNEYNNCKCASNSIFTSCNCSMANTTASIASTIPPTSANALDFLLRSEEVIKVHSLYLNGVCLNHVVNEEYYGINLDKEEGPWLLETGEPLFSEDALVDRERTLAYFEVELKSGGIYDDITIGFTGFEYAADTGLISIDGQNEGRGPIYGSYDIIGLGITASYVYLTYNGLLLRPLHRHPIQTDYRLKISLRGEETAVNVRLNSTNFLFKSPVDCMIEGSSFIPEPPEFINEGFIKHINSLLKECESQRKKNPADLTDIVSDIKAKAENVIKIDLRRLIQMKNSRIVNETSGKRRRKPSDPCVLF